jgi:hypothetical protein
VPRRPAIGPEALIRLRNAAAVHELDLISMMRDLDLLSLHSLPEFTDASGHSVARRRIE